MVKLESIKSEKAKTRNVYGESENRWKNDTEFVKEFNDFIDGELKRAAEDAKRELSK